MSARAWVERAIAPGTTTTPELYAYLPFEGTTNRTWLRATLGKRVKLTRVQRNNRTAWKISPQHLLPLASAMADRFGEIEMLFEISKTMQCDAKCQNANPYTVWRCVCACAGENHGGVGHYHDWYRTGRSTLIRHEKTQIEQVIISRGQIKLPKKDTGKTATPLVRPCSAAPRPLPQPSPPPIAVPTPPPATALPITPAQPDPLPRTVIPAADRFHVPRPASSPIPLPTPTVPAQRRGRRLLYAAAGGAIVIAIGLALATKPHQPAARPDTTQQPDPASASQEQLPPTPADEPEQTKQAPAQRVPAGCFPFQSGC
ncbi:hypothetical protein DFR70_110248 [Nocardia tenerifensis]|uniref:Uncharacterized protein n=1 Tax=Nocardia tenerifensis TaxID=228006 RepID=A0A318K065_9NOCA|nr:hypothetical protein [Nocardia tenerifensis]PXX60406.1 hypothetical protein DFR70_110248 [Nocardia tenerifensis]